MPIVISVLLLLLYSFAVGKFSENWLRLFWKQKILKQFIVVALVIFPGLLLFFLLKGEKYFYYWDFSGYWVRAIQFNNSFFEAPISAFEKIYSSINHDEYNLLPNLLLVLLNKILGLDFEAYVLSIYLVYCVPFALVTSNFILNFSKTENGWFNLLLPVLCLVFAPLLTPIRFGFIDVVGLLPIIMILSILLKTHFLRKINIKASITIGILILLLVFSRRWYAFWATAFYLSTFLVNLIFSISKKEVKPLFYSCVNLFVAGVIPLGIMLLFFYPFFEMSVLKDYGDIYAAYRRADWSGEFQSTLRFFGWFILSFAAIGLVFMMKTRKSMAAFLLISTFIIVALFSRINDFGGHQHFYLLLPLIFIPFFVAMFHFFKIKKWSFIVFAGFLLVNSFFVFGLAPNLNLQKFGFSAVDATPKMRGDYEAIMAMAEDIKKLGDTGGYTYVLASSEILNDDILRNSQLPELNALPNLLHTQHVDRRDHFPNELFLADYVLVTNPAQLHLGPENQQLVHYFNQQILDGFLKPHYEIQKTYQLEGGTTAFLLKRISGLKQGEIQQLKNHFEKLYPEFPNMYKVEEPPLRLQKLSEGNGYAKISYDAENKTFVFIPGSERRSMMAFDLYEEVEKISFTAGFRNKELLRSNCNPEKDGEVNFQIFADGKLVVDQYITHRQDVSISLNLNGVNQLQFSVDKGKEMDYCDWFVLTNFELQPQE